MYEFATNAVRKKLFCWHCCMEAGFIMPIRHPLVANRFAGVKAWLQWAELPENNFFNSCLTPLRGDLVIFDKLLSDKPHDHIGIVLSSDGTNMVVAEGNANNSNTSGIVQRDCQEKVAGFIRINNNYRYERTGRFYNLTP